MIDATTWRQLIVTALGAGLLGLMVACGSNQVDPGYEALLDEQHDLPPTGQLGVGDEFELRVYYEDALSGAFTVASDGTINYPHLGRIQVAGMTCAEIEDYVTAGLEEGVLRSPSVSCTITEYKSKQIYVFGEVQNPGSFAYRSEISIIEAFALAGGFSERANTNDTKLTRVVDGREIQIEIPMQDIVEGRQQNIQLLPGDVIYVPESAI